MEATGPKFREVSQLGQNITNTNPYQPGETQLVWDSSAPLISREQMAQVIPGITKYIR